MWQAEEATTVLRSFPHLTHNSSVGPAVCLDPPAVSIPAEATLPLLLSCAWLNLNSFHPGLCCNETTACKTEIWASAQAGFFVFLLFFYINWQPVEP